MTAAQKRRLISSTSHITQEYKARSLSEGSPTDGNTYCIMKCHHRQGLYTVPEVGMYTHLITFLTPPISKLYQLYVVVVWTQSHTQAIWPGYETSMDTYLVVYC